MRFAAKVKGAERLEERLMQLVARAEIDTSLQQAAEAVRAEAEARLEPNSAEIDVEAVRHGDAVRYSVGTRDAAASYREFGTRARAAEPWLLPAFATIAPRLRSILAQATKRRRSAA